jgi:hypothetical protein
VAIPPIVLEAPVDRDVLDRHVAEDHLEELAQRRDWRGTPIYGRARKRSEEEPCLTVSLHVRISKRSVPRWVSLGGRIVEQRLSVNVPLLASSNS